MADIATTTPKPDSSTVVVDEKTLEAQDQQKPHDNDAASVHSDLSGVQAGVQKAMILKKAWSRTTLAIAFASLFVTTLVITLSDLSGMVLEPYVTSAFRSHSAMSAARVVMNITRIIAYPVIAKLSDVFGRAEMFTFSILFQTLSFVLFATSQNMGNYFTAGLFDSIGATGFTLVQQVFLADATNLVNRAFWSTLPESLTTIPALYLGTMIGEGFLNLNWRWGYGTYAIVTPVVAVPLVATVAILQKRARKHGLRVKTFTAVAGCSPDSPTWKKFFHLIWTEIDLPGLVLLVAGLSLILIPVALTGSFNPQRWKEGSFIAMLVVGVISFAAFLVWDLKYARKPYIPSTMANRTVIAGCAIQMFDFLGYSLFTVFFPSYLQVAGQFSPGHAARIDNSLRVAFQVSALAVAVGMKYTKNGKYWVLVGPPLIILGQGLMIYLVNMPNGGRASEASFIAAKVLSGVGRAFFQTGGQVLVQGVVGRQEVAVVTGLFQGMTSVGGAIGTSISGAIWRNTLPDKLVAYLPEENQVNATRIFQDIRTARGYLPGTPAREAVNRSYNESQMILAIVATCFCVPNLFIMFFMNNLKLEEEDQNDEKDFDRTIAKIEQKGDAREHT